MFCTTCGNKIDEGSQFCPCCGAPVDIITNVDSTSILTSGILNSNPEMNNVGMSGAGMNAYGQPLTDNSVGTGTATLTSDMNPYMNQSPVGQQSGILPNQIHNEVPHTSQNRQNSVNQSQTPNSQAQNSHVQNSQIPSSQVQSGQVQSGQVQSNQYNKNTQKKAPVVSNKSLLIGLMTGAVLVIAVFASVAIVMVRNKKNIESISAASETATEAAIQDVQTSTDEKTAEEPAGEEVKRLPVNSKTTFVFTSGLGEWKTTLNIKADGRFYGLYEEWHRSDIVEGNSKGTCYYSDYSGKFSKMTKIDEYTYKLEMPEYKTKQEIGTEEAYEDAWYKYMEPYGIKGGEVFYIYLKDKPVSELPDEFVEWSDATIDGGIKTLDKLPVNGVYNATMMEGFYETTE